MKRMLDTIHAIEWHNNKLVVYAEFEERDWCGTVALECPGDCILMQSTGLRDKNGKPIYEGDIVRVLGEGWDEPELHAVRWFGDRGYPAFDLDPGIKWEESNGLSYLDAVGDTEVVGNVYENPELVGLKQSCTHLTNEPISDFRVVRVTMEEDEMGGGS